jgi:hypothetical protein
MRELVNEGTRFCCRMYTNRMLKLPIQGATISRAKKMTERAHIRVHEQKANQYASREDFRRIFREDLDGLYQLSFLLTRDSQKAEQCLVDGREDCVAGNSVFRVWASRLRAVCVCDVRAGALLRARLRPASRVVSSRSSGSSYPCSEGTGGITSYGSFPKPTVRAGEELK